MTIDWSDPATRDRLIECVGPDEYNRLHAEQMARSTVATVNGHAIHKVQSRFGSRRCGSGMSMRGGGHRRALRLRTATRFHEQRRTAGPTRRRAAEHSRVAADPFSCAGLGRHDRRPQFRSRRVGSGTYARTPHFIRSGKRMMNPSRFGIRTLGNVSALSVSFSPMSLFAAKM